MVQILSKFSPNKRSWIIGVTGPPGVGKSSIIDLLVEGFRKEGQTVAVLAVDPTSPFTGGALLGDRLRMSRHALDAGILIRSMASRGALGGLAEACGSVILFLESRGWNIIIIETVGAGQDHVEVRKLADTVIVVLSPNLGDEVQHFKAGLMEVGDLYVVNKSDLAGADRMTQQVRSAFAGESRRSPAVIKVSAKKRLGIEALINETKNHRTRLSHVALIALRRERIAALLKRATNSYAMKIIQKKVAGKFDFERMAQVFVESKVSPRRMIQAMKKELDSAI